MLACFHSTDSQREGKEKKTVQIERRHSAVLAQEQKEGYSLSISWHTLARGSDAARSKGTWLDRCELQISLQHKVSRALARQGPHSRYDGTRDGILIGSRQTTNHILSTRSLSPSLSQRGSIKNKTSSNHRNTDNKNGNSNHNNNRSNHKRRKNIHKGMAVYTK